MLRRCWPEHSGRQRAIKNRQGAPCKAAALTRISNTRTHSRTLAPCSVSSVSDSDSSYSVLLFRHFPSTSPWLVMHRVVESRSRATREDLSGSVCGPGRAWAPCSASSVLSSAPPPPPPAAALSTPCLCYLFFPLCRPMRNATVPTGNVLGACLEARRSCGPAALASLARSAALARAQGFPWSLMISLYYFAATLKPIQNLFKTNLRDFPRCVLQKDSVQLNSRARRRTGQHAKARGRAGLRALPQRAGCPNRASPTDWAGAALLATAELSTG